MGQIPWASANKGAQRYIYEKYGIEGWENRSFSRFNLVTGENGAGKSRLLHAIQDLCSEAGIPCIYLDFTKIGSAAEASPFDATLNRVLLYQDSLSASNVYSNFIPFIENKSEEFFNNLGQMSANVDACVAETRRGEINKFLEAHLGRRILFGKKTGRCFITSRAKRHEPFPFADAIKEMSPGEKAILYFACALLCIKKDPQMRDAFVLLLDEPEEHLHAKALRGLIEELQSIDVVSNNGSVFIASHSIFLLPYVRFQDIILLRNGVMQHSESSLYEDIYRDLVDGSAAQDSGLREMLSSVSYWCFGNYLMECLKPPTVSGKARADDPQAEKLLKKIRDGNQTIKLLDYGGGKGRIANCIKLYFEEHPDCTLPARLQYDICDQEKIDPEDMPKSEWMNKTYAKVNPYASEIPQRYYDFVVLYNVLHEIDVTEWAETLNYILSLLNDSGKLIFGERMVLSLGERPYGKSGYLVLGEEGLCKLFGAEHVQQLPKTYEKDPTECYAISRPREISVGVENVKDAVKALQNRSKAIVEQTINEGRSESARNYAFYCQQYINAEHARSLLAGEAETERLKRATLQQLISEYNEPMRTEKILQRSKYGDKIARDCAEWLKKNGYTP